MVALFSRYLGMIGNVVGMILMPCCFPFVISVLARFGIYTLTMGPTTLYLITGSVLLMNISHIIQSRQIGIYYGAILSVVCGAMIIYYLFFAGSMWMYHIGLIGLFVISVVMMVYRYHAKQCMRCCK